MNKGYLRRAIRYAFDRAAREALPMRYLFCTSCEDTFLHLWCMKCRVRCADEAYVNWLETNRFRLVAQYYERNPEMKQYDHYTRFVAREFLAVELSHAFTAMYGNQYNARKGLANNEYE